MTFATFSPSAPARLFAGLGLVALLGCGSSDENDAADTDPASSSGASTTATEEPVTTTPGPETTAAQTSTSTTEPPDETTTTGPIDLTTGEADSSSTGEDRSSAGCGVNSPASGEFETQTIDVDGTIRTFHILVPASYDPQRAYPVVFKWHGSGGTGLSGGLDVEQSSDEDAIIVSPDGLGNHWTFGNEVNDLALFDLLFEVVTDNYCINLDGVFSYGYSAGAGMTNLLACERGDIVRGSAAVAGFVRGENCVGTTAMWLLHDSDDESVAIINGEMVRDQHLSINGCSMQSVPDGDMCVRYEGCSEPVVWCQSSGIGHNIQSAFAPTRVWDFFAELVEPR